MFGSGRKREDRVQSLHGAVPRGSKRSDAHTCSQEHVTTLPVTNDRSGESRFPCLEKHYTRNSLDEGCSCRFRNLKQTSKLATSKPRNPKTRQDLNKRIHKNNTHRLRLVTPVTTPRSPILISPVKLKIKHIKNVPSALPALARQSRQGTLSGQSQVAWGETNPLIASPKGGAFIPCAGGLDSELWPAAGLGSCDRRAAGRCLCPGT